MMPIILDCVGENRLSRRQFLLPPLGINRKPYTVVFDLDETLVKTIYFEPLVFKTRPGVQAMFSRLAPHYEIVVWTMAS